MTLYKNTSLSKLMDLKVDVAFDQVFGSAHQGSIVSFFNALLERSSQQKIQRIIKRDSFTDEKDSNTSIQYNALTKNGKKLILLVNFMNHFDIVNRSVYYATKIFSEQLLNDLHSVIVINLLSYDLLNQSESYHTSYLLHESKTTTPLNDFFELHFFEYPKLLEAWETKRVDPWNDAKIRWLLLLALIDARNDVVHGDIYKEIDLISLRDDHIRAILERWKEVSQSKEDYAIYEERLKHTLEVETAVRKAKQREDAAFEKGSKKKQLEIAKKMLDENIDLQAIAKITGLSLREVQALKQYVRGNRTK